MHKLTMLAIVLAFGCGKDEGKGGGKGAPKPRKSRGNTTCPEKHELAITLPAGPFTPTNTLGYLTGQIYNSTQVSKNVFISMANFPQELESYGAAGPSKPDQVNVTLSLASEQVPSSQGEHEAKYQALNLAPGEYKLNGNLQVYYSVGEPSARGFMGDGVAKVTTSAPDRICGSIDVTSAEGATVKGTFNVEIVADLWEK